MLDELNVSFFNQEKFDNPFYSNCILRIMKNKIVFANIDKLCEYFDFFEAYKNFNEISETNKKEINLHEINKKNQDIYKYIKIIYDENSFLNTNLMNVEYIGEYVYLSDLLSLKYKYKETLYMSIYNIKGSLNIKKIFFTSYEFIILLLLILIIFDENHQIHKILW